MPNTKAYYKPKKYSAVWWAAIKRRNERCGYDVTAKLPKHLKKGRSYASRDAILKVMGFQTYADYLDSSLWKDVRQKAMARFSGRCTICPAPAEQVHHAFYSVKVMRGEKMKHLYPLCWACHKKIEFDENGKKRHLLHVHETLCAARKEFNKSASSADVQGGELTPASARCG